MEYTTSEENQETSYLSRIQSFFSSGNYPYVVARVRAKRAYLLSADVYEKLLMMDIHEITRFLGESRYKNEITELSLSYKGFELIDRALTKNMAEVYHEILGFSEGDLAVMLSVYLQREDVLNIKTVLRGKLYDAKPEEIMKAVRPAGKYPEEYWRDVLQKSRTFEELFENLKGNEYADVLLSSSDEEWRRNISENENKLEQAYYARLLASVKTRSEANRLFMDFIRDEIDSVNLKTLLMTKYEDVEPDTITAMLIPDGHVPEKTLRLLADTPDFTGFIEELRTLRGIEAIQEHLSSIEETGSLTHVVRALEKEALKKMTKSSYLHPLSILPVLDFLVRKKIEVENLRILARGKGKGLPDPLIREMMVI